MNCEIKQVSKSVSCRRLDFLTVYKIPPFYYHKWIATLNYHKCACPEPNLWNIFSLVAKFFTYLQKYTYLKSFIEVCYREDVKSERTKFSVYANKLSYNPGLLRPE